MKRFAVVTATLLGAVILAATVAGQGRGRGEPAPPPAKQAGHGQGKLVIWGDLASFDKPGTSPTHCTAVR